MHGISSLHKINLNSSNNKSVFVASSEQWAVMCACRFVLTWAAEIQVCFQSSCLFNHEHVNSKSLTQFDVLLLISFEVLAHRSKYLCPYFILKHFECGIFLQYGGPNFTYIRNNKKKYDFIDLKLSVLNRDGNALRF